MFKTNIDADSSGDDKDMADMVEEGKRMGLDPTDLTGDDSDDSFGTRPKDPLNPDKITGIDEPGDEPEAAAPAAKKQPAKKPEADSEEDASEEDDSDAGDEDEEEESAEGEDAGQPAADSKGKFVTKGQLGKFSRDIRRGFKDLADSIAEMAKAKTPQEKQDAAETVADDVDEFMTYAQKYKDAEGNPMDTSALKELAGLIEKQVLGKIPLDQLKGLTDLQPVVSKMSDDITREEIVSAFNTEWQEQGLTEIKQRYPNATPEQISAAQAKMFELATSEKYGQVEGKHDAYPLDYILMKEAETFKNLLYSPKRKTAESSDLGDDQDFDLESSSDVLATSFENMTPKRAKQMEDALNGPDSDDYY